MIALGRHLTIEIYDAEEHILNSAPRLERECLEIVRASGATIVDSRFQQFAPQGVSGVVVISESHFSIHTWPEHRYAAADFFTCGVSIDFEKAIEAIKERFQTREVFVSADMSRGMLGQHGVERVTPVCETSQNATARSWREKFDEANAWGLLSSIDIYHCDPAKIRDAEHIKRFVRDLCEKIEMRRFQETVVVNFGEDERVAGFSMTQLIETSLISGHFANQSDAAYIDIFSCKYYEPREAAEFALNYFGGEHYLMQVALRK